MGCDGGTIPTRDELVKTKKKPEQKDKDCELAFRWKHCAISQEKLVQPVVSCELGRLYNKESVLKVFIEKTELSPLFSHLRGMRDVKELHLTDNPAKNSDKANTGGAYVDSGISDYICPVVGLEMSGKYKFCFLWSCSCVLSERAVKEIKSPVCHKCGKSYTKDDIITLNGTEEEERILETRMHSRRAAAKAAKKSKKGEKIKGKEETKGGQTASTSSSSSSDLMPPPSTSSGKGSSQNGLSSKLKPAVNGSSKPTDTLTTAGTSSSTSDKSSSDKTTTKRKLSIQSDPKTSKVFKSLFTSSSAAKNQQQAHWVTYNPMYY